MSKKKRIYEVAREFHVSSEALLGMLRGLGHEVKSHMSTINEEMIVEVQRKFDEEKAAVREEYARKKKTPEARAVQKPVVKSTVPKRAKPEIGTKKEPPVTTTTRRRRRRKKPAGPEGRSMKAQRSRQKKTTRKIDPRVVEQSVRRTLAKMETGGQGHRHRRRQREDTIPETSAGHPTIQASEFISAAELAERLGVSPTEVVAKCFELGLMVTINQRLDMDTIVMVSEEFGYDVEELAEYGTDILEEIEQQNEEQEGQLVARPPVVTIMGHVDHGKTSLLDYIRQSNVIAGEAGGITQHIGAYEVELETGRIIFLDTPGHEAFTAMRARGAQVTDIVVLVVAADDQVMPQTIEAINHAKAAGVPIVVAINKCDLASANPEKVKEQLAQQGLIVEEWGGEVQSVEVSAKTGVGISNLLDEILVCAEVLELKANPNGKIKGVVIESRLDKGRGAMATVLIQSGTLRVGESFVCGLYSGRVRALLNERVQRVDSAGPSTPVQVLGFSGVPQEGDVFFSVENERTAREISGKRQQLKREQDYRRVRRLTLEQIYNQIQEGVVKELPIIIKGDVSGSVEALSDALQQLGTEEVKITVIHQGTGDITESDVLLASASNAVILGFHVQAQARARNLAEQEGVELRHYDIIYRAISDVKAALEGLLEPDLVEYTQGVAEVRELFHVPRVGQVAGCYVRSGTINRNTPVRVIRDNEVVFQGRLASLKRFRDDVRSVENGYECGLSLEGFDHLQRGDMLEAYEVREVARQLQS